VFEDFSYYQVLRFFQLVYFYYFQDGIFWLSIGKDCSEAKDALLAKVKLTKSQKYFAPIVYLFFIL
jgi:hypothetical protein